MSLTASRWTRLRDSLEHCATRVPLYRGVALPRPGDPTGAEGTSVEAACRQALAAFPVLTKEALRGAFPHKLVPEGAVLSEALKTGEVFFAGTSGTTGDRVQILWHSSWWDTQEDDVLRLNPLTRAARFDGVYREAVLTTPVCSGNLCHVGKLPMKDRIEGHFLFLNQTIDPSLWTDADVTRIADELESFQPLGLEGDPAYLAFFAARLARLGRRPFAPRFVTVTYEFPSLRHKAAIARAFGVPVLDSYGSTECGSVFLEGSDHRLHHNAAWSHAEVAPLPGGGFEPQVGMLLVTPIGNPWLNLVRFESGDLVRVASAAAAGDGLVLDAIEGRLKDCLVAAGPGPARLVTVAAFDRAVAAVAGLLHYRVVQKGAREADLDLVPDGLETLDPRQAAAAAASVLGFEPRARVVKSLPVEASGKFRLCRATHVDAEKVARGLA